MAKAARGWTLGELATALGGELVGPADFWVTGATSADADDPTGLAFAESDTYLATALAANIGAVLAPRGSDTQGKPAILVDRPRETFGRFLAMCVRPLPIEPNIHPNASVSPEAEVDPTASIGPFAVIERGAKIGPNSKVFSFAYVGEDCHVGANCVLYPHSVMYQDVHMGDRCVLHAGAVLGGDGFGYVQVEDKRWKVPQVGGVRLGDDVEVGANTSIDRATAGNTEIGRGTKIDNLVQIAHNCRIGEDTVIAALCGISGSTRLGKRNTLAGQVATSDHVTVVDDVTLGGRTGVTSHIKEPGAYFGLPARPLGEAMRTMMLTTRISELFNRVKALEKRLGKENS